MNKYAIFHMADTPYAYGKDLNTLVVRIRTGRGDIKICNLYYKDRYEKLKPYDIKPMKVVAQADLYDYFQCEVSIYRNRYRYFFELIDKNGTKEYFDERGFNNTTLSIKDATAFQFAYLAEGDLYEEIPWLQEAVVYQIFVDRFSDGNKCNNLEKTSKWGGLIKSDSLFGGDLQGIIDKLDYLANLGVNLLYLTPIFKSTSNHKYNTADYFDIDAKFGTLEIAKELVKKCHEKGIKIVFDAVFNHSGSDFFAFQDLLLNGETSIYKGWYFLDNLPVNTDKVNYYTFGDNHREMPKLNTNNKEVREYLLKVGEYWIKEVGIDGWRLDVCDEVDHDFWRAFKKRVKAVNNDAVIIGEIMHEASAFLKGDEMDGIMNYPFKEAMVDFFANRSISVEKFEDILALNRVRYMSSIIRQMWNLIGSHDTKRFLTECDNNVEKMKIAIVFQFCYEGVPYIYYGDEIGINGGEDPQNRKCMIWEAEEQNSELLELYKTMICIRKENKALIYGDYKTNYSKDNVLIFERSYAGETILIAINNNDKKYNVEEALGEVWIDILASKVTQLNGGLMLKPMEFKIYKKDNGGEK